MSKVYFVSDLHLGHRAISKYRTQFSSMGEHDEAIIDAIMSVSGKRNSLWMLGDCFFSEHHLETLRMFSDAFHNVNWVLGNHDTDNLERMNIVRAAFDENLCNRIGSLFGYKGFWLSHAPIHPSELRGKNNIHGHTHHITVDDDRYFSVCLEQINYKPIDFEEIRNYYQKDVDIG